MHGAPREPQDFDTPVPGFTLPGLDGQQRSLGSFLEKRRAAVVVFWSGVCSHCRRYDDYFNRFAERYPEVALVAVASRQQESLADLRATAGHRSLRFPILHDADREVAHAWRAEQTPRAFVVDGKQRLIYRGAIDNFKYPQDSEYIGYLDAAIESFLAGRKAERRETPSFGCAVESVYYQLPKP